MSGASLVIGSTGLIGKKLIFELAKKDLRCHSYYPKIHK